MSSPGGFLESVGDDGLAALWRFLAVTGCRRGEALGLTWLGVAFEESTVTISQQVVPLSGELVLAPPKTKTALRKIPVDAKTLEALRSHRATQELERAVLGPPAVDLDLVFTNLDGRPLDPRGDLAGLPGEPQARGAAARPAARSPSRRRDAGA